MKPDHLASAFLSALTVSHCPLSSKLSPLNSTSLSLPQPVLLSSGQFSQLPVDVPVPPTSSGADAPGLTPNPNARRPHFSTNIRTSVRHPKEVSDLLQGSEQCPTPGVYSCTPEADSTSSCCVQKPGGVLLHVQLWDVGIGLADSWGIHGLWPDLCNGGYDESRDGDGRAYSPDDISSAIASSQPNGQSVLDFMNKVWLSNDDSPSEFWAHEWKTHGVRVSTLDPSCFTNYQPEQEVPVFFRTVVSLFQQLDTYKFLHAANIVPSSSATYTLSDLQSAVESGSGGYVPDFVCKGDTLSQVQYYLRPQGPVQDGKFAQSHPTRNSNCPDDGIVYPEKYPAGGAGAGAGQGQTEGGGEDATRGGGRRGGRGGYEGGGGEEEGGYRHEHHRRHRESEDHYGW